MPTLYSRLVQRFLPVVLAILCSSIPNPLTLRAEILSEADEPAARRAATTEVMPAGPHAKANDDTQVGSRANSKPVGPPYVDAHVECGLAEDGVSDDGPAINACLKENAGKHIILRKRGRAQHLDSDHAPAPHTLLMYRREHVLAEGFA